MTEYTTIRVKKETAEKLNLLKVLKGYSSTAEVVEEIVSKAIREIQSQTVKA